MSRSAVTLLASLPALAVLSCTGPQQAGRHPSERPQGPENDATTARKGSSAKVDEPAVKPGAGRVTRIPLGSLFALQQENRALILDVRPAFLYQLGHIPGAVSWPKANFNSQLAAHESLITAAKAAKKPLVVYCVDFACPDGRTVATWLAQRGHSVAVLEGGWDAWKTGGLPVE